VTTTTPGGCSTVAGRHSTDDGYSSSRGADANRSSSSDASQSSLLAQASVSDHDDASADSRKQSVSSSHRTSPCTSDLEAALRNKDAELRRLRETMEQNETAIMEVLQERRRGWQAQMSAVTQEWEHKLRCQQQASFRTEQSLLLQLFKLQQENRALRTGRSHHNNPASDELRVTKARVDELQWELRERTSEVAGLTAELESCSSQLDATRRAATTDAGTLRAHVDAVEDDLAAARGDAHVALERAAAAERRLAAAEDSAQRAQRDRALTGEAIESLQAELSRTRAALDSERADFERQREQWLDEKRRVIDYQKQLQLNYLQIARKNKLLEADVHQLTAEIERHESLPSLTGNVVDESLC